MTDTHLIQLLHQGSADAMERIYREHYVYLCTTAHYQLHDEALVDDLVQDLMLDIWRRRERILLKNASLKTYLTRALQYKIAEANRQHIIHDDLSESLIAPTSDETDTSALQKILRRAVAQLPERQRECFLLSRDSGLTHQEIAEQLGISAKTVDHHITKALKLLRVSLRGMISWSGTIQFIHFYFL